MPNIEVNESLVKHVATLAKLNIEEKDIPYYVNYMKQILSYVESLDEVDTSAVVGYFSPVADMGERYKSHVDEPVSFGNFEGLLKNAPKKEEGQYKIKAIIEEQ